MEITERFDDHQEALLTAQEGHQARIWTALPGIFESFDPVKLSAIVQPAIQGIQFDQNGIGRNVDLPLLVDVPVVFPRGGGVTLTFPIAQGDECLVIFASRCIDGWWSVGGVQRQLEARMHDLSDSFAIPGPFSQAKAPDLSGGASATTAQLRSDDGEVFVEVDPGGRLRLVSPTEIVLDAPIVRTTAIFQAGTSATGQWTTPNGDTLEYSFGIITTGSTAGAV